MGSDLAVLLTEGGPIGGSRLVLALGSRANDFDIPGQLASQLDAGSAAAADHDGGQAPLLGGVVAAAAADSA